MYTLSLSLSLSLSLFFSLSHTHTHSHTHSLSLLVLARILSTTLVRRPTRWGWPHPWRPIRVQQAVFRTSWRREEVGGGSGDGACASYKPHHQRLASNSMLNCVEKLAECWGVKFVDIFYGPVCNHQKTFLLNARAIYLVQLDLE